MMNPLEIFMGLYYDLTEVIEKSALFLDLVECFAVSKQDKDLIEKVYDRLVVLGESVERLARNLANIYVQARLFVGDNFVDEMNELVGRKCERLFFWADLFRNPNLRMQRKIAWLAVKAREHLRPEFPYRDWMAPDQAAKGNLDDLKALAGRSNEFDFYETDLYESNESDLLDVARDGRRWVAMMRNARSSLASYVRKYYPMDRI